MTLSYSPKSDQQNQGLPNPVKQSKRVIKISSIIDIQTQKPLRQLVITYRPEQKDDDFMNLENIEDLKETDDINQLNKITGETIFST